MESSVIVSILLISYLISKVVIMVCQKKLKIKRDKHLFSKLTMCVDFFLDLEQEQALFYIKKLPTWNTTYFTYYLSYNFAKKIFVFFSRFKVSIAQLLIDFTNLESLLSSAIFYFFSSAMSDKQESTIIVNWKFTGLIYRILKSQKLFLLRKFDWHRNSFQ